VLDPAESCRELAGSMADSAFTFFSRILHTNQICCYRQNGSRRFTSNHHHVPSGSPTTRRDAVNPDVNITQTDASSLCALCENFPAAAPYLSPTTCTCHVRRCQCPGMFIQIHLFISEILAKWCARDTLSGAKMSSRKARSSLVSFSARKKAAAFSCVHGTSSVTHASAQTKASKMLRSFPQCVPPPGT
jgi:hypothetical protein